MVQCSTCGAENSGNETECSRCGAWLGSGIQKTVHSQTEAPPELDAEIITQRPTESMQLSVLNLTNTAASAPESSPALESEIPSSPESMRVARVRTFKMPLKKIKAMAEERVEQAASEPVIEIEDVESEELPLAPDYSEPILPPVTEAPIRDADRGHPVVTRARPPTPPSFDQDEQPKSSGILKWILVLLALVALGIGIGVVVNLLGGSKEPTKSAEPKDEADAALVEAEPETPEEDQGTTFEPIDEEPVETSDAPRSTGDLWVPGNTWIYRVTRGDSADAKEGDRQSFIVRHWVHNVEPIPDTTDLLVTFKESGGPYDKRERTSEFVIREGCYYFGATIPIGAPLICPTSVDPTPLEIEHVRYQAGLIQIGDRTVWFAEGVGFVKQELRTEGKAPLTRELLAYSIGDTKLGDADVQPVVCDWGQSLRVRRGAKKTTVRLSGTNGIRKAVLLKSKSSADLLLYTEEEVEPTALPLEYPPKYLKLWTDPRTGIEFLLVQTGTNTEARVLLFKLARDSMKELVLEPKLSGSFSTLLLANETQCFLRLRLRTDSGPQVADYSLMSDDIIPIYGSLEVSQR